MKLTPILAAGLAATLLTSGMSYAQTVPATEVVVLDEAIAQMPEVQALIEAMIAEGYTNIEVRSTMLGRAKVTAEGPIGSRVVVMSRTTGEVMRDISHGADHMSDHGNDMKGEHGNGMNDGDHEGGEMDGDGHNGSMGDGGHNGNMGSATGGSMGGGMGGMMGGN